MTKDQQNNLKKLMKKASEGKENGTGKPFQVLKKGTATQYFILNSGSK